MTCHHVADHRRIIFLVSPKSFASSRGVLGENISSRSLGNNSGNFELSNICKEWRNIYICFARNRIYMDRSSRDCIINALVNITEMISFTLYRRYFFVWWCLRIDWRCCRTPVSFDLYKNIIRIDYELCMSFLDETICARTSAMINKSWKSEYFFVRLQSKIGSDKWPWFFCRFCYEKSKRKPCNDLVAYREIISNSLCSQRKLWDNQASTLNHTSEKCSIGGRIGSINTCAKDCNSMPVIFQCYFVRHRIRAECSSWDDRITRLDESWDNHIERSLCVLSWLAWSNNRNWGGIEEIRISTCPKKLGRMRQWCKWLWIIIILS